MTILKRMRMNPPFLGRFTKLIAVVDDEGALCYFFPGKNKDRFFRGTVERWMVIEPLFLRDGEYSVINNFYEIKNDIIYDEVFGSIDEARLMLFKEFPSVGYYNLPLDTIRPLAQAVWQEVQKYKEFINTSHLSKEDLWNGAFFNIFPTILDDGEALAELLQTPQGRNFIRLFGKTYDLEDPARVIICLQILLLAEVFILLTQKREAELYPAPDLPPEALPQWQTRVMGRLAKSILKLSAYAESGTQIFIPPNISQQNAAKKGSWLRDPVLDYFDNKLDPEERAYNKQITNAAAVADALWADERIVALAREHGIFDKTIFDERVLAILNRFRPKSTQRRITMPAS